MTTKFKKQIETIASNFSFSYNTEENRKQLANKLNELSSFIFSDKTSQEMTNDMAFFVGVDSKLRKSIALTISTV